MAPITMFSSRGRDGTRRHSTLSNELYKTLFSSGALDFDAVEVFSLVA